MASYDDIGDEIASALDTYETFYDGDRGGFACAYCAGEYSLALYESPRGGILDRAFHYVSVSVGTLHKELCVICDLPCSRFLND